MVLAAALGGWLIAALTPRDFTVGTFSDDAQYAVLAKALREGHGYRSINIPGAPPEIKYPPGWPAVLALAWKPGASGPANLARLQRVNLVLVGPLAGLLALAALQVFGLAPGVALAASLAGVAAPAVLTWWTIPLSEALCLALLALGLVLAHAERRRSAALAMVAAVYVRSLAAPFLVALLAVCVWRRGGAGWRRAAQLLAIGGLLVPWLVHVAVQGSRFPEALTVAAHGSYAAWYAVVLGADPATVLLTVPVSNVPLVLQALGNALLGWAWAPQAVAVVLGAVLVALVARTARRRPVPGFGLALYAIVVLWWPFPGADRFVGSVWPLLLCAALAALPGSGERRAGSGVRFPVRWARPALLSAVTVLVAIAFAGDVGVQRHRQRSWAATAFLDSLRTRIPPGAVVASTNPGLTYLVLGNPTVPAWSYRTYRWYRAGFWATSWGLADDLWAIIQAYGPGYITIERRGAEGRYAVGGLLRQCPGVLSEIWRSPREEMLLAVHPDVPCAPERSTR